MKQQFENTSFYKSGVFYEKLGKLMQDPKITLNDLSDFMVRNETEFIFSVRDMTDEEREANGLI